MEYALEYASKLLHPLPRALLGGLLTLSMAACGNDASGGSGGSGPPGDTTAPIVVVAFPLPGALTDADRVTVRGAAGDPSGVRSIRVNDVEAQSSDGFSSWSASVALAPGANVLQVRAEDRAGNVAFPALQWAVTRAEERLVLPAALASDLARARLLVVDAALDRVSAVDLASGAVTTVSAAGTSGIVFEDPTSADVDPGRDRVLVVDRGRGELVAVRLSDGTRSVLDPGTFGGPFQPIDVAVDAFLDVAYVSEIENGIVVVDLATGAREPLGGTGHFEPGTGGVALDLPRARVLATRTGPFPALIAFDSTTGDVSVVSDDGLGVGPALVDPRDVVLDPFLARALVTDAGVGEGSGGIVAIDLVSGDRSLLTGPSRGGGPELPEPSQLVVDAFARIDVLDLALDAPVRVEPSSGDRARLAGTTVGSGIALSRPVSLMPTITGALVADEGLRALVEVDDASGARRLFSGLGVGSGPELVRPVRIVAGSLFIPAQFAFVADAGLEAIVAVSSQGARSVFSGPLVGAGPALLGPRDVLPFLEDRSASPEPVIAFFLVADCPLLGPGQLLVVGGATGDRSAFGAGDPALLRPVALERLPLATDVAVLDEAQDAIVVLHLASGARSILSAPGQGPAFDPRAPKDLFLDLNAQRLLVADAGKGHVLAVSLATGERTVLSGGAGGAGPRLVAPAGIGAGPPPLVSGSSGSTALLLTRVVDAARGAVFVLDPDGDRVLASK